LKRQDWPEGAGETAAWPRAFGESRQWCFLRLNPGIEPLKALVETFLETWGFDVGDATRLKRRNEWVQLLLDGEAKLADLIDETERRYAELGQPKPPAFFLYIDQGEELYAHAERRQARRFSELVAHGLSDIRITALMSLRTDFFGELQNDEMLFGVHRQINVAPCGKRSYVRS